MKMALCFSRHAKFFLVLMGLALLGACGGGESNEDVTSPALTMDAVAPSTFATSRDLSGTIEDGAELDVAVTSEATVGEIPIVDGTWTTTISDLEVGDNVVTLTADDSRGNTNSLLFNLVRDLFIIDQADTITGKDSSTVYGRLADGSDEISATFNENEVTVTKDGNTFSLVLDLADLAEGTYEVVITVENAAGETQTSSLSIYRDASAVSLTIDKPSPIPTDEHSLVLTGDVAADATVAVSVDTGATVDDSDLAANSWSFPISNLEERDNIVTLTASHSDNTTASAWTRITVSSLPTVAETEVLSGGVLKATFSEAMVASSVNATTFLVENGTIEGKVAYSAADTSATFTPAAPLAPGVYAAVINGVKDPDGNILNDNTLSFTVE